MGCGQGLWAGGQLLFLILPLPQCLGSGWAEREGEGRALKSWSLSLSQAQHIKESHTFFGFSSTERQDRHPSPGSSWIPSDQWNPVRSMLGQCPNMRLTVSASCFLAPSFWEP